MALRFTSDPKEITMTRSHSLKLSLFVAGVLAATSGFAAGTDKMSKEDYKAAKDKISAEYKAAKELCKPMKDNAQDVCEKEAKAKEKIAMAELDFNRTGKDADKAKLAKVKADQDYEVAKEKCEDQKGDGMMACKKEAKAMHDKAVADAKAEKKVAKAG
jgi:hypothetical protein